MTMESKPSCEKCGSNLTVIFAHGIHCNVCGHDQATKQTTARKSEGWIGGWQREPQK
jgi:ribosomal protein L37AE/L43A